MGETNEVLMSLNPSKIWARLPADLMKRTQRCIDAACDRLTAGQAGYIFLRADDVAVPGSQFSRLLDLFFHQRAPLCLAVVPAWLTRVRWLQIREIRKDTAHLWCWHQHGWRHINHQITGKKQEFGPNRSQFEIENDIIRGRQRLEGILGRRFYPVFTPPWNRCDYRTLKVIYRHGFVAVSRTCASDVSAPEGLTNFYVNVDLHTRKETNSVAGWSNLFEELRRAISSGCCGIMIHHQRMNDAAFIFLEILLQVIAARKNLRLVHFKDLIQINKGVGCSAGGGSGVRNK
jgi:hypothetical protein